MSSDEVRLDKINGRKRMYQSSTPPAGEEPATAPPKLIRYTRDELLAEPFPEWTVEGVLPETGLAAVAGEPGAGKSFLSIELGCAIAGGLPFFGLKTRQRKVAYLALEGGGGMRQRMQAWEMGHDMPYPDGFEVFKGSVNLLDNADAEFVESCVADDGVLILDTMAQATAGFMDENNSRDMGQLIAACNRIIQRKHALVILVAHVGKDKARGIRGHSSLFGALDAQITVSRGRNNVRQWEVGKAKDAEDGMRRGFELVQVTVGKNEQTRTWMNMRVMSAFVRPTELAKTPAKEGQPMSGRGVSEEVLHAVLTALEAAVTEHGGAISLKKWRDYYTASIANKKVSPAAAGQRFRRSFDVLQETSLIRKDGTKFSPSKT